MKQHRFNEPLFVLIYDIIVILVMGVLIYLIREWWPLFMLLALASHHKDEEKGDDPKWP